MAAQCREGQAQLDAQAQADVEAAQKQIAEDNDVQAAAASLLKEFEKKRAKKAVN